MPIYEYVCQKCAHHLEVMQKLSDKPLSKCPECRGKLEKIFSQTSFQLKGAGWYVTDYAGRGKTEKTETAEKKSEGDKQEPGVKSDQQEAGDKSDQKEASDQKESGDKSEKKEPREKKGKKETAKAGAATGKSDN